MTAWIATNIAPIMFTALVVFLLLGYPVAFSLAACGLFFFVVGVELAPFSKGTITLDWGLLGTLPERIFGVMNNDTLLAIPFFTLMGLVLERSGMAEDLLDTIGQLFGTLRGGLAYAVIFVGALLAATTGVVAASVISMGLISLPIMMRYGYDRRVASGVIAASGTLAQIIPPSLVLIVMADQLGRSVGDMYKGAFIPGMILACLYASYILLVSFARPSYVPGLPVQDIGFKETQPGIRDFVSRLGGLITVACAGLMLWLMKGWMATELAGDVLDKIGVAAVVLPTLAILAYGLKRMIGGGDERGLASLLGLTLVAALVGYWAMRNSTYDTPDFIVLVMAVGIIVAFAAACLNWVLGKATGFRFMSLMAQQATFVMVPPLFLIFLVLGTIFIGVATPTEGGAMGATGAMILAFIKRLIDGNPSRFNYELLKSAVWSTAKLSAFVLFILVGARVFSLTFYAVNGHLWVEHLLVSLPGGQTGFLIVVNVMVFLLAFFLDFFELAFIIVPLLGPAAEKLGIDLIWFGVILGVNMQTSFMHPPFGFALFYLRSVAPTQPYRDKITGKMTDPVTTGQIYWGAVPFVIIQCIMVGLVIALPGMVMVYKKNAPTVDPSKIEITVPTFGGPGGGGSPFGTSPFGSSPFGAPPPFGSPPGGSAPSSPFGGPPPGLSPPPGLTPPAAPPVVAPAPAAVPPAAAPAAAPAPAPATAPAPAPAEAPKAQDAPSMPMPAPNEPPKIGEPPKQ